MEDNKPKLTDKWWFWVIVTLVVLLLAFIIGDEETPEQDNEPVQAEEEEEEEADEPEVVEEDQEENQKKVIELNKEMTSADYTVEILRVIIEDDMLTVVFEWENQSDWNPAHFELLGSVTVEQDGEVLEELSGDRKYKQIEHGMFDLYDLEYELINESDITIRITSAAEYDDSQDEFIIEYE